LRLGSGDRNRTTIGPLSPLTSDQRARVDIIKSAPNGCDAFGRLYRTPEADSIVPTTNALVSLAFYDARPTP
jgi:hypothetical protein